MFSTGSWTRLRNRLSPVGFIALNLALAALSLHSAHPFNERWG